MTYSFVLPPTRRERVRKWLVLFFGRRLLCPVNRHICAYGPYRIPVVCLRCNAGWEEMPKGSVWKGRA